MDCASGLVKILLAIFNLLFFLVGLAFVILGTLFLLDFQEVVDAIPDESLLNLAPISIIVIGAIILVIAFFGCCGAFQKNTCMLKTYACFLLIILIIQVAIGIYAIVEIDDENDFRQIIEKALRESYDKYSNGGVIQEYIDVIQQSFECCGLISHTEWAPEPIPESCYLDKNFDNQLFLKGCSEKVSNFLIDSINVVGIVALALGVTEVLASVFALCLSGAINKDKGSGRVY